MKRSNIIVLALVACDPQPEPTEPVATDMIVPTPGPEGWGEGDQAGNGNTQSYGTRLRCAARLLDPQARVYELGHEFSETMPQALFDPVAAQFEYDPSISLPFTKHIANGERYIGSISQQGTQIDALGHFGVMRQIWDPTTQPAPAVETAVYYNGFTQAQVKPDPAGPLEALGIENAPPIITTAVILDIEELLGRPMEAGELITATMVKDALDAQVPLRRLLPGDAVFLRTGWGDRWVDPEPFPDYYLNGPGLSLEAAQLIAESVPVVVGLDNPFTDPFRLCQVDPAMPCPPPAGTPPGLPSAIHHFHLVQAGIHQIQNMNLTAIADDDVDVACTMILPLRIAGGSGSMVRPVAVGR